MFKVRIKKFEVMQKDERLRKNGKKRANKRHHS
jgi:hypothetical protein